MMPGSTMGTHHCCFSLSSAIQACSQSFWVQAAECGCKIYLSVDKEHQLRHPGLQAAKDITSV